MKITRLLMVSLMLALLTLGVASASDINEASNNLTIDDASIIEVSNEDIEASSGDGELLGDGEDTFSEFQTMLNDVSTGGTLTLTKNYIGSGTEITIDRKMTIDGNNHIMDANGASRIFNIEGTNVTIKNLIIKNGHSSIYGGGIYFMVSKGNLINCTFLNCSAERGGGVFFNENDNLINDCSFINCSADSGGGVYCQGPNTAIYESTFANCSADYAATVYYYQNFDDEENNNILKDCSIENCSAKSYGAIFCGRSETGSVILNIIECNFTNCSAKQSGGVVYNPKRIINSTFLDCSAARNGGAVYIVNSPYMGGAYGNEITNSSFMDCSAKYGGAIYLEDANGGHINNCSFMNCSSTQGGAICFNYIFDDMYDYENPYLSGCDNYFIIDSDFIDCTSGQTGGAIYLVGNNALMDNCSFTNCSSSKGGAICLDEVKQYNAMNEKYYTLKSSGNVVNNSNFVDCKSNGEGGAIYWKSGNGTVNNTSFNFSNATSNGGAIYWEGNNGKIENSNFTKSKAKNGGALFVVREYSLSVSYSKFENNTADELGSTIYSNPLSVVNNCNFKGNDEIYVNNATPEYSFSDLKELIDMANEGDTITLNANYINDGTFTAAGITISKSITIDGNNNTLDANSASKIFTIEAANVTLKNINIKNGHIYNGRGGAISWSGANGTISNCTFMDCLIEMESSQGGAISWSGANGTISNCSFLRNTAYSGGAIYWDGANGKIENSVFTRNSAASEEAQSIHITNDDMVVSGCTFEDVRCNNIEDVVHGGQILDYTLNGISHGSIDLEISLLTDITGTCEIGNPFNMTVTVHNRGSTDATGAYVSLSLTPFIFVTSANTLTGEYSTNGTTWDIGNLGADQTATLTVTAHSIQSGNITITSTATASQSDVNSANNMDQLHITVLDAQNTFEDLNTLIEAAGNTLILTKDYYGTGNQIEISKSITIDGNGHTLDAKGMSRIFKINAYVVTLTNIVFKNGNVDDDGGAIYFEDNGNVINCNFINNTAINGGAVYFYGNRNVTNCNFTNNTASEYGGAIYFYEYYSGRVENSKFTNSKAKKGAAIYAGYNNDVIIANCIFENNTSEESEYPIHGGTVSNCTINGNKTGTESSKNITAKIIPINCNADYAQGNFTFQIIDNETNETIKNMNVTVSINNSNGTSALWITKYGEVGYTISKSSTFTSDENGIVTIKNANFYPTITIGDNVFAPAGNYTLVISGYGNLICNATMNITINEKNDSNNKTNPNMTVRASDITYGEKLIFNVILPDDSEGDLNIKVFKGNTLVNQATALPSDFNGNVSSVFSNLKIGEYTLNVEYMGDSKYENVSYDTTFTVRPKVIVPEIVPAGTNANIYIDFGEDITDTIIIKIGKRTFDVLNINKGIVNATTKPLDFTIGNYTLTLAYEGDEFDDSLLEYNGKPIEYNIEIVPVEIPIEEEIQTNTEGTFTIEIPIDAKGTITLLVDGEEAQTFDAEKIVEEFLKQNQGSATNITMCIMNIDLSKYGGKHTITFKYSGDENYHAFTKEANVTVRLANPSITATPTTALYTADATYTIKVYKDTGILAARETVIVKLNGKTFKTLTTTNGIATFKITQNPGPYTLTITSLGKTITKTLTVKHLVTLKTATVKRSAKKLTLQATLAKVNGKYLKNKKITFKFNGKKYTAKTNKKGIAKVTVKASALKKLKAGKKITYQATYLKDTVKKTAKVKK